MTEPLRITIEVTEAGDKYNIRLLSGQITGYSFTSSFVKNKIWEFLASFLRGSVAKMIRVYFEGAK